MRFLAPFGFVAEESLKEESTMEKVPTSREVGA
jgi:hypothetical protein